MPQGPNGPLIPEIHQFAPHAKYVPRRGELNAWDNPEFVAAVGATDRKTLVIAGTITSVCMAFPAISAVAAGYKVFAVVDAFGGEGRRVAGFAAQLNVRVFATVVELSAGSRPFRPMVDFLHDGAEEINAVAEVMQVRLLGWLGTGDLLRPKA